MAIYDIGRSAASRLLLIMAGACLPVAAWTAEVDVDDSELSDTTIDEIVVVAHKIGRPIRDIAANVTVISRTDIADNLTTTLGDVFRYAPGIDYEAAGTRFGNEGISIRGIGGNRVALLVDGIPLSDQFDVGSFSNATRDFVNAGLVQRMEVLHGPASALYGSSAIGGVVAVRTPDPVDLIDAEKRTGGDLMATWRGADGSMHGTGLFALGDSDKGLLLGASLRDGAELSSAATDVALDTRDYQRRSALLKFVADTPSGQSFRISWLHQDSEIQSDFSSMLGSGRYRSTTALQGDDSYQMDMLGLEYDFGSPGSWIDAGLVRAYYEIASVEQTTLDERALARTPVSIDRYFQFDQDIQGIELNLHKELATLNVSHQLGFGVEYRQRDTEEYRDGLSTNLNDGTQTSNLLGEVFPLRDFPISTTSEWGAYIEDVMSVGDWSIIAALRGDYYSLSPSVDSMYAEDYPFAEPVSISDSDLSPKLGLIWHAGDSTDLYLQYSHGFRAPPYEDANIALEIPFFNYRAIPNPDLGSERSNGIDIGLRWHGQDSRFRVALFRTSYEDFIESKVRLGTDPVSGRVLFQSQNLSEAVIEGFEAGGEWRGHGALESFSVDGSLYIARGENRENGEALNSVGPGQAVIGLRWYAASGNQQVRLQSTFTEEWTARDESAGELFKPPGYAVFDLYFSQRLGQRVTLRAGLLNLTDETYWNWADVGGLSPDDPLIPTLAQAGRSVSISINMHL